MQGSAHGEGAVDLSKISSSRCGMPSSKDTRWLDLAKSVLDKEASAILTLKDQLGEPFCRAVRLIGRCRGSVAVCGVGKAGLVGKKISATLASTGTRSLWLDPVDAMHGDLGMLGKEDVALLISNSGETGELLLVAQALKGLGIKTLAVTGHERTPLGQMCDLVLPLGRHQEADAFNLAPTTTTTVMLALGDALAVTLEEERGFTRQDYAQLHPAGALGRRLRKVTECMRTGDRSAYAKTGTTISEAIHKITQARCGMCLVVDDAGRLLGVFTDGDLRRSLEAHVDIAATPIETCMTSPCKFVEEDALVEDAIEIVRSMRINAVAVVNGSMQAVGILDIQDVA
jgi:arabinose-5-phosphate isomerase